MQSSKSHFNLNIYTMSHHNNHHALSPRNFSDSFASLTLRMLFGLILLCAIFFERHAQAHLLPAQHGTIHLQQNAAFVAVALPVSASKLGDLNHDGYLSTQEAQAAQQALAQEVLAHISLLDGEVRAQVDFIQINAEQDHSGQATEVNSSAGQEGHARGANYFLALIKFSFPHTPVAPRVKFSFFGRSAQEQRFQFKTIHEGTEQVIILTPEHNEQLLFPTTKSVFSNYMSLGFQHIWQGWDHLAFLLTMVLASRSWRQLGLLTLCFTFAHSLSLGLSLWKIIQIPSAPVEILIAVSIIGMGLLNFARRDIPARVQAGLIVLCGLVHGLGFASSMSEIGLQQSFRALSLLAFNLGIEVGQLSFMVLPWLMSQLAKRLFKLPSCGLGIARLCNGIAVVTGSYFLYAQIQ